MLRPFSALLTRPAALATSAALHLGAVIAGGHALSEGSETATSPRAVTELEVQLLEAPPPAPRNDEERRPARTARAPAAGHHHDYAVPPGHDAHPHDSSLIHVAVHPPLPMANEAKPTAEAPLRAASPQDASERTHSDDALVNGTPPRFVLGAVTTGSGAPARAALDESGRASGADISGSAVLPESSIDEPARLLSRVPVVYPEGARAAGVEADVPLELIVDVDGRVRSARCLADPELGIGEAALVAVRGYRFRPARRAGHAVPVRMRWIVTFRLQ